jgi:predicted nucleotidyltransferase
LWIPAWLGEVYSQLYAKYGTELFKFQEARSFLSLNENKLAVAFSKLHSRRLLLTFETGKPRLYRLLDPQNFILLAAGALGNLEKIPQEKYVKLICDVFRQTFRLFDVSSFALYGSITRGRAKKQSDIDTLIVSEDFIGSVGSRIEKLYRVEELVKDELAWLRKHGIYTSLSFTPLRREEAERAPFLFLDLTEEAIILYDRDQFLNRILTDLKAKLLKLGARRVFINEENWYWDLKPDYKFGEVVQI